MPQAVSIKKYPVPPPGPHKVGFVNRAIHLYIFILATAFFIEWGYAGYHVHVLHTAYAHVMNNDHPATTPLFFPAVRFTDWTNFILRVSHYGEPGMQVRADLGYPYPYPLPSIYIFLLFIRLFRHSLRAYICFTLLAFIIPTLFFSVYLGTRHHASKLLLFAVWITCLLSSPAQFLLDRGNIEVFLWLFILLGLVAFVRGWQYVAAFFFALAACMKIYPALYFLLFLPRRQYKAAALGIALTAGFSLAALAAVGPTITSALHDMSAAAIFLRDVEIVALNPSVIPFDHSLFALEKQSLYAVIVHWRARYLYQPPSFRIPMHVYSVFAPLSFAAIYLLRLRRMPLLNQYMALTICSVVLPYVSYDYTLVDIYLVFGVFILFLVEDKDVALATLAGKKLGVVMACFAVVFAPLACLANHLYGGQIKCIALISLLAIALRIPMPSTLFGDRLALPTPAG